MPEELGARKPSLLVHDWPQDAIGQALPSGVYEVNANQGFVWVGDCSDTPRFAVEAIGKLRSAGIRVCQSDIKQRSFDGIAA